VSDTDSTVLDETVTLIDGESETIWERESLKLCDSKDAVGSSLSVIVARVFSFDVESVMAMDTVLESVAVRGPVFVLVTGGEMVRVWRLESDTDCDGVGPERLSVPSSVSVSVTVSVGTSVTVSGSEIDAETLCDSTECVLSGVADSDGVKRESVEDCGAESDSLRVSSSDGLSESDGDP
jgi:hypothetical protein